MLDLFTWSNLLVGLYVYVGFGLMMFVIMYFVEYRKRWQKKYAKFYKQLILFVVFLFAWVLFFPGNFRQIRDFLKKNYSDLRRYIRETRRKAKSEKLQRARLQWIAENPVTLYYTVINGVIAVMRSEEYDREAEKRERFRQDGLANEKTLIPLSQFVIFFVDANAKAKKDIEANWWYSGTPDNFDMVRQTNGIIMKKRDDITVPFVSRRKGVVEEELQKIGTRLPSGQPRNYWSEARDYLTDFKFPKHLR